TPASGEPRRGLRSAAAVELLASFCLCFLKKTVRQDGVHGAVTFSPDGMGIAAGGTGPTGLRRQ
ncbi:hypothetical protein, partial [Pseudomonas putida]|uniref:hypothetical protein n=1 Tax=Pseudomonas putida TaxID=303 RepID=UPI0028125819